MANGNTLKRVSIWIMRDAFLAVYNEASVSAVYDPPAKNFVAEMILPLARK